MTRATTLVFTIFLSLSLAAKDPPAPSNNEVNCVKAFHRQLTKPPYSGYSGSDCPQFQTWKYHDLHCHPHLAGTRGQAKPIGQGVQGPLQGRDHREFCNDNVSFFNSNSLKNVTSLILMYYHWRINVKLAAVNLLFDWSLNWAIRKN